MKKVKQKRWIDTEHKFVGLASSKSMAWMLFRNEAHKLGLKPSTLDKIKEITDEDNY